MSLIEPSRDTRTIAFLILHATAHNAGFTISDPSKPNGHGFEAGGSSIADVPERASSDGTITYEKLIIYTKEEYGHIISQTNERFKPKK